MQWVYAVFGLVVILAGGFVAYVGLFDKIDGGRLSRLAIVLFALVFMGFGVWLAWPIFAAIKDLRSGSHHAQEIIRARKALKEDSDQAEYVRFQNVLEGGAVAFAAGVPFLLWGMRRRDPGSRRPWIVLAAGLCAGYVVLVHWGLHLLSSGFGGDVIEQLFREWLSRHQTLLTFGLYVEMFWVIGLALSNFTGMPVGLRTAFLAPVSLLPVCPDALKAPSGEKVILVEYATGVQIYTTWRTILCSWTGLTSAESRCWPRAGGIGFRQIGTSGRL